MSEQQELFERIDDYLNERMSVEEQIAFEKKIAMDEALAAKVNEARSVDEAIYYASLADLKKTIGQDIKQIKYNNSSWNKTTYLSVAAGLLATSLTIYFVSDNLNSPTQETSLENPDKNIPVGTKKTNENPDSENRSSEKEVKKRSSQSDPELTHEKQVASDQPQTDLSATQNNPISEEHTSTPAETKGTTTPKESNPGISPPAENKPACDKSFKIQTEPSCVSKETGSITIHTDGSLTFTFKVEHASTSGAKGFFTNLPSGNHEVVITYNETCSYTKSVTIGEKWCPMNRPFSFNPDIHEHWEISYESGSSGTFSIFDRSGKEIYKHPFGSGNEQWNGTDQNGNTVPIGTYVALIQYSDGRKEKVELTIVR